MSSSASPPPKSKSHSHGTYKRVGADKRTALVAAYTHIPTGQTFPTKAALGRFTKQHNAAILRNFERHVADQTLGQDPWEQLPGETPTQYSRFQAYLMMAKPLPGGRRANRSVVALAQAADAGYSIYHKTAIALHWSLRAKSWDKEMDRQVQEEFAEERRNATRRHAQLGRKMQKLAERVVDNHILVGAVDVTPSDAAKLAQAGVTIERLANDQSTRNDAVRTETRLVWEGPTPPWMQAREEVVPVVQADDGSSGLAPTPLTPPRRTGPPLLDQVSPQPKPEGSRYK